MALRSISGPTVINFQPSYKDSTSFLHSSCDSLNLPAKRSASARLEVPTSSASPNYPNALIENTSPSASSVSSVSEDRSGRRQKSGFSSQPDRRVMNHEKGWSSVEWSQGDVLDKEKNGSVKQQSVSHDIPRQALQPILASTSKIPTLPRPLHRRSNTQPVSIDKARVIREKPNPFRRWMSTLRRAGEKESVMLQQREKCGALDESAEHLPRNDLPTSRQWPKRRTRSSSGTSSAFVTGVKSASISLATSAPTSRAHFRRTLRSSEQSSQKARSSVIGYQSLARSLVEDQSPATPTIDQASFNRAIKRRDTLRELVHTEEGYVADLKVLVNVCIRLNLSTSIADANSGLLYSASSCFAAWLSQHDANQQ